MSSPSDLDCPRTLYLLELMKEGTSWLNHGKLACELDWALLRGATAAELASIRSTWREHIHHLRRRHGVEVTETPNGYFRLTGVGELPPGTPDAVDDGYTEDEDLADEASAAAECPTQHQIDERIRRTAKALMGLHQAGELTNPMHKASVGMFIRQASECHHWHNTAHFRSRAASALIAQQDIRSAAQYQSFCRKNLRHEHVVPNSVIYQLIIELDAPSQDLLEALLQKLCIRATITRDEDQELAKCTMPEMFYDKHHEDHGEPLLRYREAGLVDQLEARTTPTWWPPR